MNYAKLYTLRPDGRYMGYWHDEEGKRHAIYDRDAEKLFHKIKAKEQHQDKSVKDVGEEWYQQKDVGYKAMEAYIAPLKQIYETFGAKAITDVSSQEVSAFLNYLKNRGYARRTVQLRRDVLNMMFNYAILKGYTQFNPVSAVNMPKGLEKNMREPPCDEALQEVIKHKDDDPFSMIPYVLLMTGMRRQEILGLRQEDIDRKNSLIYIRRAVEFQGETPVIKDTKTKTSVRAIPLLCDIPETEGYIFGVDGELMSRWYYRKHWSDYCAKIGYSFTAHQLRHAYATRLFELNIAPKDAQALLGHADIETTMNIYTHISQSHKDEITDKLKRDFLKKF